MNSLRALTRALLRNKRWVIHVIVVFLILLFYCRRIEPRRFVRYQSDALQYVTGAFNMAHHGVFSLYPEIKNPQDRSRKLEPANYRPPGFSSCLAVGFILHPRLRALSEREAYSRNPHVLREFYYMQHAFLILASLITMVMVIRITDSMLLGWVSMILVLYTTILGTWVNYLFSETLTTLLVTVVAIALYFIAERPSYGRFLFAGIALGCLTLTRATFYYFIPIPLVLFAWLAWRSVENRRLIVFGALIFFTCLAATVGSWMNRNYYHFGRFMLARRGGHLLIVRANMNMMTKEEYSAAFWFWTPPSQLREFLRHHVDTGAARRFLWTNPDGFQQVSRKYRSEMDRKHGFTVADAKQKSEGIRRLASHPLRHLGVCVPLAYRSIMVSNPAYSFFLFISFFAFSVHAFCKRNMPLLFFLSIGLFNFAFVVFLTHSEARYNG
ncbi:MAG: hypothetical protein WBF93_05020, partial [Pirellulales bacterium]